MQWNMNLISALLLGLVGLGPPDVDAHECPTEDREEGVESSRTVARSEEERERERERGGREGERVQDAEDTKGQRDVECKS